MRDYECARKETCPGKPHSKRLVRTSEAEGKKLGQPRKREKGGREFI